MEPEATRIEFPCDYPITTLGENTPDFEASVVAITQRHAPEVAAEQVRVRNSRAGNYQSVTIVIRATGEPQLKRLHEDLKRLPAVRLVL